MADAKKPEKQEELEQDAKKDRDPKITQKPTFLTHDTTLNVLPSTVGGMLVSMGDGGLSNLVAGARASVGISSGRYMFEAKIVESAGKGKPMVRFGFSAEGSLFLGEEDNSVCFDNDGFLVAGKKKTKCSQQFGTDVLVAIVLNRDASSENNNTISMFKNGVRVSQPQPLPEALKGKTLFPAVSFKSATVHTNFAAPAAPLPFKCKTISDATTKESEVTKSAEPADGKYNVLFPVSLPDEGTFDYLDSFLEKNPTYTELSDRAFADWATKSGLSSSKKPSNNDKPDYGFGQGMDDFSSIKKALMQVAALAPRDFVIMEVKGNLIKEEREKLLAPFQNGAFKTTAEVAIGEPASAFKRTVQQKTLEAKQAASDKEFKAKKIAEKLEWQKRKKAKDAEKAKKKVEKERKKKVAEAQKKAAEALKKRQREIAEKKAKAEGTELPPEEEEKEPEPEVEDEEPEEPDEPEPADEKPPKVAALTSEEKAVKFFKHAVPDLAQYAMNTSYMKFSLPDGSEGFDAVKYSWNKEREAATYLKEWIAEKKSTTRIEDIKPGDTFKKKLTSWQSSLATWKSKQSEYKQMLAKKEADKKAKIAKKEAAEKKAKLEAEKEAKAKEEGKEYKAPEKAPEVEEEEEEPEPAFDFEGLDVFGVDDILDIGNGNKMPLVKDFQTDDFTMAALRAELSLLVHAFAKDCGDSERTGIHIDHLSFYWTKYFGKTLTPQSFGVTSIPELIALVDDTACISKGSIIESLIPESLETFAVFAKLTEDARRLRIMQVDMGNESAKLKIRAGGQDNGQKRSWEDNNQGNKRQKGWGGNWW